MKICQATSVSEIYCLWAYGKIVQVYIYLLHNTFIVAKGYYLFVHDPWLINVFHELYSTGSVTLVWNVYPSKILGTLY